MPDKSFSAAGCVAYRDCFGCPWTISYVTIYWIWLQICGYDSTSEMTAAGADRARDVKDRGGPLQSSAKKGLIQSVDGLFFNTASTSEILWLFTVQNGKCWLRRMRFGLTVEEKRTGFDQIPRILLDTVGDREFNKNVKTVSYRPLPSFSACSTKRVAWSRWCCFCWAYSGQDQWKPIGGQGGCLTWNKIYLVGEGTCLQSCHPEAACGGSVFLIGWFSCSYGTGIEIQ